MGWRRFCVGVVLCVAAYFIMFGLPALAGYPLEDPVVKSTAWALVLLAQFQIWKAVRA